jgi:hypothetical protein
MRGLSGTFPTCYARRGDSAMWLRALRGCRVQNLKRVYFYAKIFAHKVWALALWLWRGWWVTLTRKHERYSVNQSIQLAVRWILCIRKWQKKPDESRTTKGYRQDQRDSRCPALPLPKWRFRASQSFTPSSKS